MMIRTHTAIGISAACLLAGVLAWAQGRGEQRPPDPRSRGGGDCRENAYNCIDTPNPLPAPNTVWLEEMTWMDVRDAMKAGKTTAIISTGGIEPNGPWLVLGKHNYVLKSNCDAIARMLGNALCAPVISLVPEGGIEPKTGHMLTAGTLTVREATFEAVLTDVVSSLKTHGFHNIILIGDSGGNQAGQKAVAHSGVLRLRQCSQVSRGHRRAQAGGLRPLARRSGDFAQHVQHRSQHDPVGAAGESWPSHHRRSEHRRQGEGDRDREEDRRVPRNQIGRGD
jgi:hypothetical protein